MAHIDLVALWPDVDVPGFDAATLPEGATVEEMRNVRQQYKQRFDVSAPNPENLDRRNLAQLLPRADGPELERRPFLTVVGHDPETFAEENEVSLLPLTTPTAVGEILMSAIRKALALEKHWLCIIYSQFGMSITNNSLY